MKPSRMLTRRNALLAGAAAIGGVALGRRWHDLPPGRGNVLRMADALTYGAHRTLLPDQSLVREYTERDITSFPAVGHTNPAVGGVPALREEYERLQRGAFADWRLTVEGRVSRPGTLSLADLKQLTSRTQITRHTCEEGWTAIAKWTGVPLSAVLDAVGILPTARFVVFYSYDDFAGSLDMSDALHPQTLLAYGMNSRDLAVQHGAPVRLRVERQLGYKSLKYIRHMVVTDTFADGGDKGDIASGWSWYTGI